MPAGLNLPTNISLQTSVKAENPETKGESELVVAEKDTSGFASVINKISPETTGIGKSLPEDGSAMAENQQIQDQSDFVQEVSQLRFQSPERFIWSLVRTKFPKNLYWSL